MGVAVYHVALCRVKCCQTVGGEAGGEDYGTPGVEGGEEGG